MRLIYKIIFPVGILFAAFMFKAAHDESEGSEKRLRDKEASEQRMNDAIYKSSREFMKDNRALDPPVIR